jgi:prepilin-type N-terminal cleavage/methylation domain-containing protein/prepilin-type processing-associated H-X9-DG protein
MNPQQSGREAFTLIELLVVLAMIAILAGLILPVHAKTKEKGQALRCLGNNKQLVLAALMYANDSQGSLPPNGDEDGDGSYWIAGNLRNSSDPGTWNVNFLTNSANNKLAPYTGSLTDVYRCPSDRSSVFLSGRTFPRIRSYSMSLAVGTVAGSDAVPNGIPSVGLWLNGRPTGASGDDPSKIWYTYGKSSDASPPGPASVFVFADEDVYSIGMASFAVIMTQSAWVSWPSTRHGNAGTFSFLDGHAELHQWLDGRTKNVNLLSGPGNLTGSVTVQANNPDIGWLQSHTSAHR